MTAEGKIVGVVLIAVSLLLEADVIVSLQRVAVFHAENEPLGNIPEKERQIEKFALLSGVDKFMVEFTWRERPQGEDNATQINGEEVPAKRMPTNLYHHLSRLLLTIV